MYIYIYYMYIYIYISIYIYIKDPVISCKLCMTLPAESLLRVSMAAFAQ